MNVLFFPIYISTPHFETELELMETHIKKNDDIYIVKCNRQLKTCLANPLHKNYRCIMCQSRFNSGISKLSKYPLNIINFSANNNYEGIPQRFNNINEIINLKINDVEIGLGAASSLVSRINKEHQLDTVLFQEEVIKDVKTSYDVYVFFNELLNKIKPDSVYFFNGRFSSLYSALNLCRNLNILFYTHERAGVINKYSLIEKTTPHDTNLAMEEKFSLWNSAPEDKELIGETFFTDRRKGVMQSWLSFTKAQIQSLIPNGFDESKRNIVIYNSTIEEYFSIKGWEKPFKFYQDELDGISQILKSFSSKPEFVFYLRIHPNLKNLDNTQMRNLNNLKEQFSNVRIIAPEDPVDSYALLEKTEKTVVFGSTIGVEACYWGKPAIAIGKTFYEGLDCCYYPQSHLEMISLIEQQLIPKPKIEAIKYGYWELKRGIDFIYFRQTGLQTGLFKGEKVQASFFRKVIAVISLIFRAKSVREVLQTIKENV